RFQSADAVLAHRLAERVYLAHDLAQRVEAPTAARAETVVALAQRGEKVRDRLQRAHDPRPHGEGEAEPEARDERQKSPEDFRRVVARDQKRERDQNGGRARGQSHQEHAPLVAEWLAPRATIFSLEMKRGTL